MATIKELIKSILGQSDDYTEKELKKLRKGQLENIIENIDDNANTELTPEELEIANQLTEFHGIDGVQEIVDMKEQYSQDLSDHYTDEGLTGNSGYTHEEEEEDVVIDIDISKLSKYEQRHYAKTGELPQVTINRYTRFDDVEEEDDDDI